MTSFEWQCCSRTLHIGTRPLVMGILNVTPDSFSDGGLFLNTQNAIEQGLKLIAEGADILDIGGESTRPGSQSVSEEEELARVAPVVRELAKRSAVPLSVDTSKAKVAEQCLEEGAVIINDVTGLLGDPRMASVVNEKRAGVVIMHMQGTPQTMQHDPRYEDVVREVAAFFEDQLQTLTKLGLPEQFLVFDPGIGFGKTLEHNLQLLAATPRFLELRRPLCIGVSRKGFIGTLCNRERDQRLAGSLSLVAALAYENPGLILRVHDVSATRDAAILIEALHQHRKPSPAR